MKVDLLTLPEDVTSLKKIIYSQSISYEELRTNLDQNLSELRERNTLLEEQIRLYRAMLYGRKSEKNNEAEKNQLGLFNEAEETASLSSLEEKPQEITVPSHIRKKSGRRPLPDDLPREEVIHDLAEDEKVCACGSSLSRIGEEVSEKLDIVPARVRVIKHIRYKYACKGCVRG